MSGSRERLDHPRGITLIELMVVVAIIGVLAAIGGVAYMNHMRKGKVAKLKQIALEVQKGQEQYASRNAQYLDTTDQEYKPSSGDADEWEQLLEFQREDLADITVETDAGTGSGTGSCDICPGSFGPNTSENWYAVRVRQDMKPGGKMTTVFTDSHRENLVELHQGE